jgi:hypothetical protein
MLIYNWHMGRHALKGEGKSSHGDGSGCGAD